jgi:hypothetical protein
MDILTERREKKGRFLARARGAPPRHAVCNFATAKYVYFVYSNTQYGLEYYPYLRKTAVIRVIARYLATQVPPCLRDGRRRVYTHSSTTY